MLKFAPLATFECKLSVIWHKRAILMKKGDNTDIHAEENNFFKDFFIQI